MPGSCSRRLAKRVRVLLRQGTHPVRGCSEREAAIRLRTGRAGSDRRFDRRPRLLRVDPEILHEPVGDQRQPQERERQVFRADVIVVQARSLVARPLEHRPGGCIEWDTGIVHC